MDQLIAGGLEGLTPVNQVLMTYTMDVINTKEVKNPVISR